MTSRVLITGVLTATALLVVLVEPLWVLLLAPVIFGVPHVLSDLRYLVLRQINSVNRRAVLVVAAPILALFALGLLAALGVPRFAELEIALGLLSIGAGITLSPLREGAKVALMIALFVIGGILLQYPRLTLLTLVHLHNILAVGIWIVLFRGARSGAEQRLILIFLVTASASLALFGSYLGFGGMFGAPSGFGVAEVSKMLTPGAPGFLGETLIRFYAFFQLVHYIVWLFLIPNSTNSRPLREEIGSMGVLICAALTLSVVCVGILFPIKTRELYLTTSSFHAWLELGLGTYLLLRSRNEKILIQS